MIYTCDNFDSNLLEDTPIDEFMINFKDSGTSFIKNLYDPSKRQIRQSCTSGTLSTSLPEDAFTFINAQTNLLDEYLIVSQLMGTKTGDGMIVDCCCAILNTLFQTEVKFGNMPELLVDIDSCIAVSNDCLRMIERVDKFIENIAETYPHLALLLEKDDEEEIIICESNICAIHDALVTLYGQNAVYCSQSVAGFILETIQKSSIPAELFSQKWENELVQNEIAMSMIRTFEEYLSDIHNFIEQDFLYHKIIASLARCTVCFYIQCFVNKANRMRLAMKLDIGGKRREKIAFRATKKAIIRFDYDIEVFQDYFTSLTKDNVSLRRIVMNELYVLSILVECMHVAAGTTSFNSFENFAVVVHKRTGANSIVTKHLLSDLWLLFGPKNDHRVIENAVHTMQAELQLVSTRLKEEEEEEKKSHHHDQGENSPTVSCLKLDAVLKNLYQDRIIQEESSLCGNILRDVREFRQGRKLEKSNGCEKESDENLRLGPSMAEF